MHRGIAIGISGLGTSLSYIFVLMNNKDISWSLNIRIFAGLFCASTFLGLTYRPLKTDTASEDTKYDIKEKRDLVENYIIYLNKIAKLLTEPKFVLIILSSYFFKIGSTAVLNVYFSKYLIKKKYVHFEKTMMAIGMVGDMFGRISCGYLIDLKFDNIWLLFTSYTGTCVTIIALIQSENLYIIIGLIFTFTTLHAGAIVLITLLVINLYGIRNLEHAYGILAFADALGVMTAHTLSPLGSS